MLKRPKLENTSSARKKTLLGASSALALLLVVSACGSGDDVSEPAGPAPVTSEAPVISEEEARVEEDVEDSGEPAGSEAEDIAYKAEQHLELVSLSREGLIEQLVMARFEPDAVADVVDTLGLDWNEQAAQRAKNLLERTAMDRDKLISDLSYEGFTDEQAAHGADAAGL